MGAVGFREESELGGVEINEGVVEMIGILFWVISGDLQKGGALFLIDCDDVTKYPLAAGEGADDIARLAVEKIEVVESGALTEPQHFFLVTKESVVAVLEDVNEFVRLLGSEDSLKAGIGVDFDEAVFPEAAFDVGQC